MAAQPATKSPGTGGDEGSRPSPAAGDAVAIFADVSRNASKDRFSDKPGKWIYEEAQKKDGVTAELIDLRNYPLPFYDEPMGPAGLQGKYSTEIATQWAKKVAEADAYIVATPEYNHGYPAVLKNALDYAYNEWNKKPIGFVSWGGVAGA